MDADPNETEVEEDCLASMFVIDVVFVVFVIGVVIGVVDGFELRR